MAASDPVTARARGEAYRNWDGQGSFEDYWDKNKFKYLSGASRPNPIRPAPSSGATTSQSDRGNTIPTGRTLAAAGCSLTAFVVLLPIAVVIVIVAFSLIKTTLGS